MYKKKEFKDAGQSISSLYIHWKWLVTQKLNFSCRVSPISTRLFCYVACTFKSTSDRLFKLKISQCVSFLMKNQQNLLKICKKGTNCEIFNLDNQRLRCLKVQVMHQKSHVHMGGNPTKKNILSDQSLYE